MMYDLPGTHRGRSTIRLYYMKGNSISAQLILRNRVHGAVIPALSPLMD